IEIRNLIPVELPSVTVSRQHDTRLSLPALKCFVPTVPMENKNLQAGEFLYLPFPVGNDTERAYDNRMLLAFKTQMVDHRHRLDRLAEPHLITKKRSFIEQPILRTELLIVPERQIQPARIQWKCLDGIDDFRRNITRSFHLRIA